MEKIAIIGGGVGGCLAAFWLSDPALRGRYEVTLYQMGWRLGGKGASGRNQNPILGQRSEEHGLHIWFGFYENAFHAIKQAYKIMGPNGPFKSWEDAYNPQETGVIADRHTGKWDFWQYRFPKNGDEPGDGTPLPSIWEYFRRALAWLVDNIDAHPHLNDMLPAPAVRANDPAVAGGQHPTHLHRAHGIAQALPDSVHELPLAHVMSIASDLFSFVHHLGEVITEEKMKLDNELARLAYILDLGVTSIRGALADGVLFHGFDSIDNVEFQAWLKSHGARFYSTTTSGILKGLYDLPFAYEDGMTEIDGTPRPNMGAGTALRCLVRIFFGYKGSYIYKMNAGMGETVFTPFYLALKERGVKFEFFHRLENLGLSADGESIETLTFARQATLVNGTYDPLISFDVNGTPFRVWPDAPRAEQISSQVPQENEPTFESAWCQVKPVETRKLTVGQDFHQVVLATSLGPIPTVAKELLAVSEPWRKMVEKVKTVRTQCVQLWMLTPEGGLGWNEKGPFAEHALVDAYIDPINTWMDQSVILETEKWTAPNKPQFLAYFCGPMREDPNQAPLTDAHYPESQRQKVFDMAQTYFKSAIHPIWPNVTAADGSLDWTKVFDPFDGQGEKRAKGQYYRCNIDPSERYVLSVAGSLPYRLRSDRSGFRNLYLAGDWTVNGLNAGCVEAAAISGCIAARGISGIPAVILGEKD